MAHQTSMHTVIPNANKPKATGVIIFVVAVVDFISGIDEIVKFASDPFKNLLRVKYFSGFWNLIS